MLFSEEEIIHNEVHHPKSLWKDKLISTSPELDQIKISIDGRTYPHCSIISGQAGSGQLLVGLHIAQSLLCASENKPCGSCSSCYKVNGMIHPDLNYTFPVIGSGEVCVDHYNEFREIVIRNPYLNIQNWVSQFDGENKQVNINVAEARSVIKRLSFAPFESNCKVLLIWLPEYLGKESNILLKLLEEPPGNSFIIMVTEDLKSLLSTVKSRSQLYKLNPLSTEEISNYLVSTKGLSKSKAIEFAIASDSNISLCLDWIEDQSIHTLDLLKLMFQKAYLGDPLGFLEWIEQMAAMNRDEQKQFFSFLTSVLSLCLKSKLGALENLNGIEIIEYAEKIAARLDLQVIENLTDMVDESIFAIQRNANIRILLLDYMIRLSGFIRNS